MDLESIYNQSNMFGYDSLSDEQKQYLRDDANRKAQIASQVVQDNGIGAIQKIGNGQEVYGKLAKAVRKYLQMSPNAKSENVIGLTRMSFPDETLTLMEVKDMNIKGKNLAQYLKDNNARGVTAVSKPNASVSVFATDGNKSYYYSVKNHEIGHHFNLRTNVTLNGKYPLDKAAEHQANAYSFYRGGVVPNEVKYPEIFDLYKNSLLPFKMTKIRNYGGL